MDNKRICTDVINEMLNVIPTDKTEFIKDLLWNLNDASYKAPEETLHWMRTSHTLQKHIIKPKEEWEFQVLSIFSTQPIQLIKDFFYPKQSEDENKE